VRDEGGGGEPGGGRGLCFGVVGAGADREAAVGVVAELPPPLAAVPLTSAHQRSGGHIAHKGDRLACRVVDVVRNRDGLVRGAATFVLSNWYVPES